MALPGRPAPFIRRSHCRPAFARSCAYPRRPRRCRPRATPPYNGVPLDALVAELGSNRNAIYKTLFDARRKLRAALVTHGYLDDDVSRQP